ncbi:DUF2147 domain-containing protein [soil metagenome]
MKAIKYFILSIFILAGTGLQAQGVTGNWHTINEETGQPNSLIEIYESEGEIRGKVIKILKEEDRDQRCSKCKGDLKDQPIEGLELMTGFERSGNEYTGGLITDPKSGKQYKAKMWIDQNNPDELKVRGYVAFFYKTQTWQRAR